MQLSLPVHLPDDETFNSYYPAAGNDELIQRLRLNATGQDKSATYVWGLGKSGRTHLLHAACAEANNLERRSFYIPLGIHACMSIAALEGVEHLDLVCIDDVDAIAGHPIWEEAIFDLYNRMYETGNGTLIVTARTSPSEAKFILPDLASRMQWGLIYQLHPMADEDKLVALQRRSRMRGLQLPEDVGRFLLNRVVRDLRTLFEVLDKLDKASMVHQRKLTIPFVKEILRL